MILFSKELFFTVKQQTETEYVMRALVSPLSFLWQELKMSHILIVPWILDLYLHIKLSMWQSSKPRKARKSKQRH